MEKKKRSGFILVGAVLLLMSFVVPQVATVIGVDTTPPMISSYTPAGTSSNPTAIERGQTLTLSMTASDVGSGVTEMWISVIDISANTIVSTKSWMDWNNPVASKTLTDDGWIVPSTASDGKEYRFRFGAYDKTVNQVTIDTYGKVTVSPPIGKLYVNDTEISSGTTWFATNSFTFKFQATSGTASITSAYLKISDMSKPFNYSSSTGEAIYSTTLSDGVYTIECGFNWEQGSVPVATLTMGVNEEPSPPSKINEIIQVILGISGVALILCGVVKKQ